MTTLEDANVGEFIKAATAARPGVATSVGRLRAPPMNASSARSTAPSSWPSWAARTHACRGGGSHLGRGSVSAHCREWAGLAPRIARAWGRVAVPPSAIRRPAGDPQEISVFLSLPSWPTIIMVA